MWAKFARQPYWLQIAGVGAGAFVLGAIAARIAFGNWGVFGSTTAASWAQAIGTVGAIGVAIYSADKQIAAANRVENQRRAREREIETGKATALAIRLVCILTNVRQAAVQAHRVSEAHIKAYAHGPAAEYYMEHVALNVPIPDDTFVDMWTLPLTLIAEVSTTLDNIARYDRGVKDAAAFLRTSSHEVIAKFARETARELSDLIRDVDKSIAMLETSMKEKFS